MPIRLRVKVENETEWDIVQRLYILMGYTWGAGVDFSKFGSDRYLSIWYSGLIGSGNRKLDGIDDLSLKEFLDYIEDNDIGYNG